MTLVELEEMIAADSIIDQSDLGNEALKIAMLHSKYYSLFIREMKASRAADFAYAEVKKFRTHFYLGKCPDEVYMKETLDFKVLKQDLELYLEADRELVEADVKRLNQRMKSEMLEAFVKRLNTRSFDIKNAIEWRRFTVGLN